MEEILASIRRIISDDDEKPAGGLSATPAAFQPEPVIPVAPRPVLKPIAEAPAPRPAMPLELLQELSPAEPVAPPVPPVAIVPPPVIEEPVADILELTDEMRVPETAAPFRTIEADPDVIFAETKPKPAPEPVALAMKQEPEMPAYRLDEQLDVRPTPSDGGLENPLMSNTTTAAVDTAFSSLAHTVLTQNARTLDDIVKDMLRPMLKSWLDDNLPSLVERLVRAEIERVSRGR